MLGQLQADLSVAKAIQKHLIPNQLEDIAGFKAYNKYISGSAHFTESFDIIASPNNKFLWIVLYMTEGFGLSSLLTQTLLNLQNKKLLQTKQHMDLDELFDELSIALNKAHNKGQYRLCTLKIDLTTLKVYGISAGMPPLLSCQKPSPHQQQFSLCCPESWPASTLEAAHSSQILSAEQAVNFCYQAHPGEKLFITGAQWNALSPVNSFYEALTGKETESRPLLDQVNNMSLTAAKYMQQHHRQFDFSLIALEIDSRKLHLA